MQKNYHLDLDAKEYKPCISKKKTNTKTKVSELKLANLKQTFGTWEETVCQ